MSEPMTDEQVEARIEDLEREEQALRSDESEATEEPTTDRVDDDATRLKAIRVELDRLWDYLRQRRALRDAGEDPDGAGFRDEGTIEGYLG